MYDIEYLNDQSFTKLYNEYRVLVYEQVMRMTRSAWHAEEIVQEVFMRAWLYRNKIAAIRDIKSWLFIVTKRIIIDYVVKLSREKNFLSTYKRNAPVTNYDALVPFKCRQLLSEAEQQLSARQKQVYDMKFIKRLHQKEIARQLNISEFTAIHHIKTSASIVKNHILMRLEMGERKRA